MQNQIDINKKILKKARLYDPDIDDEFEINNAETNLDSFFDSRKK